MFTSLEAPLGVTNFSLIDPATPEKRGVFSPHTNAIVLLCSVNTGLNGCARPLRSAAAEGAGGAGGRAGSLCLQGLS